MAGDTAVSLWLTTRADRLGRRRMLLVGAILMAAAGLAFAATHNFLLLTTAGTIGVVSPSGNEVGPFLPIERAATCSSEVDGLFCTRAMAGVSNRTKPRLHFCCQAATERAY